MLEGLAALSSSVWCVCLVLAIFSRVSCHTAPIFYEYCTALSQCACSPGWIGEFCQYVGDACLIKPDSCLNGATCMTISQPSSPPDYTCKCPHGFTGKMFVLFFLSVWQFIAKYGSVLSPQNPGGKIVYGGMK